MVFLWFLGHEASSFHDVADRFNILLSSLRKIIERLTMFCSHLAWQVIRWPTVAEKNEIEHHFRNNRFPGVIGVLDGTHVPIDKPSNNPNSYLNRKHYFSIIQVTTNVIIFILF